MQVRRRAKGCLSYVVGAGDTAFVIDPSVDVTVYERIASAQGWRIAKVFDTHLHADHISGARLLARRTGATVHLNPADTFDFAFEPLGDRDVFTLPDGTAFGVAVLHTPGHTEGSTIFQVGDSALLTGDTLFVDGVGRPDLAERAEEFARNLHRSLTERVLTVGDEVLVLPSHYGDSVEVRPDEPVGATVGELVARLEPLSFDETTFAGGHRRRRSSARRTTWRSSTPTWAALVSGSRSSAGSSSAPTGAPSRHDSVPPGVYSTLPFSRPEQTMELPDETISDLLRRLRRIEGQVRGIQTMLTEQRECSDVVTQIAAASKALEQVGFKLVASGLTYCLANPDEAADAGYDLARVEKMFMKIA